MSRSAYGLDTRTDADWRLRAECGRQGRVRHGLDADAWSVARAPTLVNRDAAKVCNFHCPVRAECGDWYDRQPAILRTNVIAGGWHYDGNGNPRRVVVRYGPPPSDNDLLFLGVAAEIADVPDLVIAGACAQGLLPHGRDKHNRYQIRRGDLMTWLAIREPTWTT